MADFLELGIDASGAKKGADDFAQAGKKIEESADKVEAAGKKVGSVKEYFSNLGQAFSPAIDKLRNFNQAADNISSGGTNASQSVNNLSNSLRGLASQMGGLGPTIGIVETALAGGLAGAAVAAGAALAGLTLRMAEAIHDIKDMSQEINISVERLQQLKFVGALSGVSFETIGRGLEIFEQKLEAAADGDVRLSKELQNLGINAKKAVEDPESAINTFLASLQKIPNAAERVSVAKDLMGKSGARLVRILDDLSNVTGDNIKEWERLGIVLKADQVEAMDTLADKWEVYKRVAEGALNRLALQLVPVLGVAIDDLTGNTKEASDGFEQFGRMAANAIAPVIAQLRIASREANLFWSGIQKIGRNIGPIRNPGEGFEGLKEVGKAIFGTNTNDIDAEIAKVRSDMDKWLENAKKGAGVSSGNRKGIRPPKPGKKEKAEKLTTEEKLLQDINNLIQKRNDLEDAGMVKLMERRNALQSEVQLGDQILKLREELTHTQGALLVPGFMDGALPGGYDAKKALLDFGNAIKAITPEALTEKIRKLNAEMLKFAEKSLKQFSQVGDPIGDQMEADAKAAADLADQYSRVTQALEKFIIRQNPFGSLGGLKILGSRLSGDPEGDALVKELTRQATLSQSAQAMKDYREQVTGLVDKYKDLTDWEKLGLEVLKDTKLTETDRSKILDDINAAQKRARLEEELGRVKSAVKQFSDGIRDDLTNAFYQGIVEGPKAFFQTLLQGFSQTLAKLSSELLTSSFFRLLGMGGSSSNGGGLLSGILGSLVGGLVGGGFSSALAGAGGLGSVAGLGDGTGAISFWSGLTAGGHASGGTMGASGWTTVGELGPERVFLPRGAYVESNYQGRQGSGGGAPVVVNMNITAPNPAAFQQSRDQVAQQMAQAIQRASRNN